MKMLNDMPNAKRGQWLAACRRAGVRRQSKYMPHIGAKQIAKGLKRAAQ